MDHDLERWHRRAREKSANPLVYGFVRVTFQLFFWVYFRMRRIGREHVPKHGPVIIAANHRSFLDPFVIACMARRPMYYVAKEEIFRYPVINWLLAALGAFPVRRGASDAEMITTAKAILARGDIVLIFPEGTRTRPGPLGRPRRGVGRLALETGVSVVPMAVLGTEAIRRGWRLRPHRVRLRAGRPLRFPQVDEPSKSLAGAVTDRIWPCVMLQWEWLGGQAPIRHATVVGTGRAAASLGAALTRAGVEVHTGAAPDRDDADAARPELLCLAVPAADLPDALSADRDQITDRVEIVLVSDGLVPPLGTLPAAYAGEHSRARAVALLAMRDDAPVSFDPGSAVLVASPDRGLRRHLCDLLTTAGLDVTRTADLTRPLSVSAGRQSSAA